MDRSLYPDGVEVRQDNLTRTESTRQFHILQRHIDNTLPGVVSGLQVTPNVGNGSLIDISNGYGYTPNGELVELPSSVNGSSLASYIDGTENIVALIYTETNDNFKPHETSGETLPTSAARSYRLRIFTRAQFDALPTSDDNLSNDSIDRALIVAIIEAQGSGVAIPITAIQSSPIYSSAITIENTTNNITGVAIVAAESGTPSGTGSLSWNYNNGTLTWIAPDDISGNPVNVLDGGLFELISSPSGRSLNVYVSSSLLPLSNQSDIINLSNLYFEEAPRHTSEDIQHRSLVGSGVPTINNPHGLTLADLGISGTPIEEHQVTFHSNGIRRDSDPTTLATSVNTATSPDELSVSVPGQFYVYLRGTLHNTSNDSIVAFDDVVDNTYILYDIYATVGANDRTDIEKIERVRINSLSTFTDHVQLSDLSEETIAGVGTITYNDTTKQIQYEAPGDTPGASKNIPASGDVFIRLFSNNLIDYIDLNINSTLSGTGNHTIFVTISDRPTTLELKDKLLLTTVFFSGASTGFLGNGFGVNNAPNTIKDKRLFGITSPFDLRDDALPWFAGETSEAQSPAAITNRQVSIIDLNYDFSTPSPYASGLTQFGVLGKAHYLGRSAEQFGVLNTIQYDYAEDGFKQGIRSNFQTSFASGTISNAGNIIALNQFNHAGTITESYGLWSRTDVDSGANVVSLYGAMIRSPGGTHTPGVEITNLYGLRILDQTAGVNNYAIKTGIGRVEIGDELRFEAGEGIDFGQPYTVGVPNVMRYYNLFRHSTGPIIDGSTAPGEGTRVSVLESLSPSTTLNDFMTSDFPLSNQALLFEICDGSASVDGRIIFAQTPVGGMPEPILVIGGGTLAPGLNNTYYIGSAAARWYSIWSTVVETIVLRVGNTTASGLDTGDAIIMGGLAINLDIDPAAGYLYISDINFRMYQESGTGDPILYFNYDGAQSDYFRYDRSLRQHAFYVDNVLEFSISGSATYSNNRINLLDAVLPSEYLPVSIDQLRSIHRRNLIGCWGYINTTGSLLTSYNVASYSGSGTFASPWLINQSYAVSPIHPTGGSDHTPISISIYQTASITGTYIPTIALQSYNSFSVLCYVYGSPSTNPGLHFIRMA